MEGVRGLLLAVVVFDLTFARHSDESSMGRSKANLLNPFCLELLGLNRILE